MAATAPPPPALPPRTYPRSPLALYTTTAISRPQTAYERYQVLLAFFRRLSFTLTLAGSSAAVLVWIWRSYYLPKWTDTNAARSKVAQHQLQAFQKLLASQLKPAARRGQGLALLPSSSNDQSQEHREAEIVEEEEEQEEVLDLSTADDQTQQQQEPKQIEYHDGQSSTSTANTDKQQEAAPVEEEPRPPRPQPLDISALDHVTEYANRSHTQFANKNSLPASTKAASGLLTSLSSLNAEIATQSFLSTSSQSTTAPASARTKSGSSDLAQIKAEIRSLKGVLLSRRNFGYGRPTASVQSS
ncbi:hypothetical protein OC845_004560 [Tilletia horrida]|nr:hypothetical protein OC845_004560 [Tilletia horrida]